MDQYVRLCKGVYDKGILVHPENVIEKIDDSLYYYTESQYAKFQETGSVKGVHDVATNKFFIDFDSKPIDLAKAEALTLIERLQTYGSIIDRDIEIYFSGSKGFHVSLTTTSWFTPSELRAVVYKHTKDLKTVDRSIYDAVQIIRVPGTKHQLSNLYKIPLTLNQFKNFSIKEIELQAMSVDNIDSSLFNWSKVTLSDSFLKVPKEEVIVLPLSKTLDNALDYNTKPKFLSNCRWSLQNGYFKEGTRNGALLCLAATYKSLGFDIEHSYRLLKGVAQLQSNRFNTERYSDEELYNNICMQVYNDTWKGGIFTCKEPGTWLYDYCNALGKDSCKNRLSESSIVTCCKVEDLSKVFYRYAEDFERNIIRTGLAEYDKNAMHLVSTLNGLLGQPGSGKTSTVIDWLEQSSRDDIGSIFFSLDMGMPVIYGKLIQRVRKYGFKEALHIYKHENKSVRESIDKDIGEHFKNVNLSFRSGMTPEIIRDIVKEREDTDGKKIKLMAIDYLECLAGNGSSDTLANTSFVCNQLKDLANELELCIVLLLQTQKHSTADISDPLMSMKMIKGASTIEQSMSVITTLWREGYNPKYIDQDKFISFAVVKNRFGQLWTGDFKWIGREGKVSNLEDHERNELARLREDKAAARMNVMKGGWS